MYGTRSRCMMMPSVERPGTWGEQHATWPSASVDLSGWFPNSCRSMTSQRASMFDAKEESRPRGIECTFHPMIASSRGALFFLHSHRDGGGAFASATRDSFASAPKISTGKVLAAFSDIEFPCLSRIRILGVTSFGLHKTRPLS